MPSILWLVVLLVAQARAPAPTARASIDGVVKRPGATFTGFGAGLASVTVELKGADRSVTTGPGGTFSFRSIAPGSYTLIVSREGFVPDEDARGGVPITLAPGQSLKDIVIYMLPAPTISGVVYDPYGEPLAAALVQAHARLYTPYGPQVKVVKKVLTNDLGEFRLFWLNFGQYVVSATYGDRPLASAVGRVQLSANVPKPDDGYIPVFYGGATQASQGQAVRLAPGADTGSLSINLGDVPRFKIKGRISPPAPGSVITIAAEGNDLVAGEGNSIGAGATGDFEIHAVSPGNYVLLATAQGFASDLVSVSVTREDVANLSVPMAPAMRVTGRAVYEAPLPDLKVKLVRRTTEIEQRIESRVDIQSGAFALSEVGQGEYDVLVEPLPPATYVKSISHGGRDILLGGFAPIETNQQMQIVLSAAFATVEGHVDKAGRDLGGAQVVLVPEPRLRRRADRYITGSTDARGNFQITNVPPGQYTAYAFEDIEPGAYFAFAYSASANARFAEYGMPVNTGQLGGTKLQLKGIPAAEAAGGLQ